MFRTVILRSQLFIVLNHDIINDFFHFNFVFATVVLNSFLRIKVVKINSMGPSSNPVIVITVKIYFSLISLFCQICLLGQKFIIFQRESVLFPVGGSITY